MRIKVFDVVELKDGDKATIIEVKTDKYKVAIFDRNGSLKGYKYIIDQDIINIIYAK